MEKNNFWDNYCEQAILTAVYPNQGNSLLYPVLGLIGECSEISNKIKKILRDDGGKITDKKTQEIGKETGDCLWYIANICREANLSMQNIVEDAVRHYLSILSVNKVVDIFDVCLVLQKPLYGISIGAKRVKDGTQNDFLVRNGFGTDLRDICVLLIFLCNSLGLSFETVGKRNIENLLCRQKRNTLHGSGDDR